ncbi:MAG: hypothetical protein QOE57_1747 [Acidimicrobiaceae bacterium]|nr:hypothetical protein [Acidimicrobiaceae bacterium]
MGRGQLAGDRPVTRPQDVRHLPAAHFPQAHIDHGAYDRPHHLLAERRRFDLEAQHAVAEVGPRSSAHPSHQGAAARRPAAERPEVVLAVQRVAGQAQRAQVEGALDVPGGGGQERVELGPVEDGVAVGAAGRGAAGVEPGGRNGGRPDDDGGTQGLVESPLQGDGVDVGPGVAGDDLAPGVDARVGPARADDLDSVAQVAFEGGDERAADGVDSGLYGEAVEPGPDVGDVEADPNRRAVDDGWGVGRGRRLVAEEGQL